MFCHFINKKEIFYACKIIFLKMEFQTKVTFQRKNLNKTELNSEKKPLDK